MPIFSTITLTTVNTVVAPLISCTAQLVVRDPATGQPRLHRFNDNTLRVAGLTRFAGAARPGAHVPGRTFSYRFLRGDPVHILMRLGYSHRGKSIARTLLMRCAPAEEQGSVKMRYGNGQVTLLAAPMQRLNPRQSSEVLGALYTHASEYQDKDYRTFGLRFEGMTPNVQTKAVRTVGAHGEITEVHTTRKPRRISGIN